MAFKPVGPCNVFLGDFTAGGGGSLVKLVDVENVQVDLGIRRPYTSNAVLDGVPTVDGLYDHVPRPVIQMTLVDADISQLEALLIRSKTTTTSIDALGFGDSFAAIAAASVPSLFIQPTQQSSSGASAVNGIWFPAVRIAGLNGIQFGRTGDQEIQQAYQVNMDAVYRATDQNSGAIPAGFRVGFMGPPAGAGITTWTATLPS